MKRKLAKTVMIALGLGVLVTIAAAQEPEKGRPRPDQPYVNDGTIKDDSGSIGKVGGGQFEAVPEKRTANTARVDQPTARTPRYKETSPDTILTGSGRPLPQERPADNEAQPQDTRDMIGLPTNPKFPAPGQTRSGVRWGPADAVSGEGTLAQQAEQVARSIGAAKSDAEKVKLKSQLSEVLEKQFDSRQRRHEHEIGELEAQVRTLRELVQKRQENRREIIAKRLDVIVRDAEGLGW